MRVTVVGWVDLGLCGNIKISEGGPYLNVSLHCRRLLNN